MKLLPASHLSEAVHDGTMGPEGTFNHRLRQDAVDESQAVTAAVGAGGAVFFHDLALHASHPNVSGRDRWAWIGTYRDALAEDLEYSGFTTAAVVRGQPRALT